MLMSRDEYIFKSGNTKVISQFSEPKYLCPKCKKGGMCKDLVNVLCLTSNPPKYLYNYMCNKCFYEEQLGV